MKRDNKPNVVWTPELVAQVTDLWRQGISARDIARQVRCGLTKNSVIGRMHRMNIDPGLSPSGRKWHQPSRTHPRGVERPVKARKPRPSRSKAPPSASLPLPVPETPPPLPKPPPRPPPPPRPIPLRKKPGTYTLLDLRPHECKWPVNDPPRGQGDRYLFCGQPQFDGQAYCEYHCRVGFSGKGMARATAKAGWQPRQVGF